MRGIRALFGVSLALAAFWTGPTLKGQEQADLYDPGFYLLKRGDLAPRLHASRWMKGAPVKTLARGRVHVVVFWATWNGPSRAVLPRLGTLARQYDGKVSVIGVNGQERAWGPDVEARIDRVLAEMGDQVTFPVARDTRWGSLFRAWVKDSGQKQLPAAFIVGGDGRIAWIGSPDHPGFEKALASMVAGLSSPEASRIAQQEIQAQVQAQEETQQAIAAARRAVGGTLRQARRSKDPHQVVKAIDGALEAHPVLRQSRLPILRLMNLLKYEPEAALVEFQSLTAGAMALDAAVLVSREAGLKPAFYEHVVRLLKPELDRDPALHECVARAYHEAGQRAEAVAHQKALMAHTASLNASRDALRDQKKALQKYENAG